MENSYQTLQYIVLGFFTIVVLYIFIHFGVNKIMGKDITDGLFEFKRRKRDEDVPD